MPDRRSGRLHRATDTINSPVNGEDELPAFGIESQSNSSAEFDDGIRRTRANGSVPLGTSVDVVRLSVNLLPETAATLKDLCRRSALNLTEGIKRSIRLWKLIDDANAEGGRVLIETSDP